MTDAYERMAEVAEGIRRERARCEARMRAYGEQCRMEALGEGERRGEARACAELMPLIAGLQSKLLRLEREMEAMRSAFGREPTERIDRSGNGG